MQILSLFFSLIFKAFRRVWANGVHSYVISSTASLAVEREA